MDANGNYTILERIIDKMLSGRFILTVIVGMVFSSMAVNGILSPDKSFEIIFAIVVFYFARSRAETTKSGVTIQSDLDSDSILNNDNNVKPEPKKESKIITAVFTPPGEKKP